MVCLFFLTIQVNGSDELNAQQEVKYDNSNNSNNNNNRTPSLESCPVLAVRALYALIAIVKVLLTGSCPILGRLHSFQIVLKGHQHHLFFSFASVLFPLVHSAELIMFDRVGSYRVSASQVAPVVPLLVPLIRIIRRRHGSTH